MYNCSNSEKHNHKLANQIPPELGPQKPHGLLSSLTSHTRFASTSWRHQAWVFTSHLTPVQIQLLSTNLCHSLGGFPSCPGQRVRSDCASLAACVLRFVVLFKGSGWANKSRVENYDKLWEKIMQNQLREGTSPPNAIRNSVLEIQIKMMKHTKKEWTPI